MSKRVLLRLAKSFCFMLCVLFLGQITVFADEVKPIHEYNFDIDSGATVVDSINEETKIGGIATGTNSSTFVTGYNGTGNARQFNGNNDYIIYSDPVIPLGGKSIRFRIKKDASTVVNTDRWESILSTHDATRTNGLYIGIGPKYRHYVQGGIFILITNSSKDILEIQTPTSVCDGKWHDILFTWDGTTDTDSVKLYLDDMTTPVALATPTSTESDKRSNLSIGRCNFTGSGNNVVNFNGYLDDIQIYGSSITPNSTTPGNTTIKNKVLLVITMLTGERKEYEITADKINDFIAWYNSKAASSPTYVIDKDYNKASFTARKDYITYDQISNFEVNEYND